MVFSSIEKLTNYLNVINKKDTFHFLVIFFCSIFISLLPYYLLAQESDDEPSLHVGGALRYNVILESYESDIDANSSAFTMDTWRINV
ncbi:MAG: hypothetical protein EA391_12705, partial [Balneolaceae bacterium]